MATVTLHGFDLSTYVRTVRTVCGEKGIGYTLAPIGIGADADRSLHPFARMPVMDHGNFRLYETLAIATYLDEVFDGPTLVPGEPKDRARMFQWISVINDYGYKNLVMGLVIPRLVVPMQGGETDMARIAAALPEVDRLLAVFDEALEGRRFLAGDGLSLADLFLQPITHYVAMTPEGGERLPACRHLSAWMESMGGRTAVKATEPRLPAAA